MVRNRAKEFLINLALDTKDYDWISKIEKLNYDFTKKEDIYDVFEARNLKGYIEQQSELSVEENDILTIKYEAKDIFIKVKVDKVKGNTFTVKSTE